MSIETKHRRQRSQVERRRFLGMASTGAAAAAIGVRLEARGAEEAATQEPAHLVSPWFKDPGPFIQHIDDRGYNLESRLEDLSESPITPNELFFVRNNSVSVEVDPESWRLRVEGDGVDRPLELSYSEILQMPTRDVSCIIECGGDHRDMYRHVMNNPVRGDAWKTGAIGMARWTGVPLSEVLRRAGISPQAREMQLTGLDEESPEGGWQRPLPVKKAMDGETILAHQMNGVPLPPDHGFPLRAIVPGWVGAANIKWLASIHVSRRRIWSRNNTTSYVLIGAAYRPEGQAQGKVIETYSVNSALALPWRARLNPGPQRIRGFAWSPFDFVDEVEWSVDGQWRLATLIDPAEHRYGWRRFEFVWNAQPGEHQLTTRARDRQGNRQPDRIPHNLKGYLFNQPLPHPVTVI